jgi:tripartite-type tricarboxylate transporter receptor subunit TctC
MKLSRRAVVVGASLAPFAASTKSSAQTSQAWPSGTIRLVVVYPPGGSTDAMMRMIQPTLQQRLGATVIIENRAGASGSVGTASVAKSPPDGNTWLVVFDNHAANPFVLPPLPYDTEKDFDPTLLIGTAPYLISTAVAKPHKTIADLIGAAKEKPGTISYASVGSGSVGHLAMTLFAQRAGVQLTHVPYRGGGPAMNDALAGHVDLLVGSTALSMPQVNGGKLRAIAQTGKERSPTLPNVPTVAESGFPGFEAYAWWGLYAPAGTPKPIIERMSSEMAACFRDERVSKPLIETQQVSLLLAGPAEQRKFLADQMKVWGDVVRAHNIKAD